jgi:hypothetical protein
MRPLRTKILGAFEKSVAVVETFGMPPLISFIFLSRVGKVGLAAVEPPNVISLHPSILAEYERKTRYMQAKIEQNIRDGDPHTLRPSVILSSASPCNMTRHHPTMSALRSPGALIPYWEITLFPTM